MDFCMYFAISWGILLLARKIRWTANKDCYGIEFWVGLNYLGWKNDRLQKILRGTQVYVRNCTQIVWTKGYIAPLKSGVHIFQNRVHSFKNRDHSLQIHLINPTEMRLQTTCNSLNINPTFQTHSRSISVKQTTHDKNRRKKAPWQALSFVFIHSLE